MKWYRMAAEQGDKGGQFNLGLMYDRSQGVPHDFKEAVKWHRLAAEQGDGDAQLFLGFAYKMSELVSQHENAQSTHSLFTQDAPLRNRPVKEGHDVF